MKKKILAFLLASMMILSMLPAAVFAEPHVHEDDADPLVHINDVESQIHTHDVNDANDANDVNDANDANEAETPACPGEKEKHTLENCSNVKDCGAVEAECDKWGYTIYQCLTCGNYFADKFVSKKEHVWKVTQDKVEATCTEDGKTAVETCELCGEEHGGEAITKLGHDWKEVKRTGNCVNKGLIYSECTRCGEEKTEDTVGTGLGHDWDVKPFEIKVEPTCCAAGVATYKCEVCEELKEVDILPTDDHTLKEHKYVAQTCTEDGNIAYWECTVCGKYFADADASKEVAKDEDGKYLITLEKAGHKADAAGWTYAPAATCTVDGLKKATCSVCEKEFEEIDPATGHSYEPTPTEQIEPTCTTWGFDIYACKVCGDVKNTIKHEPFGHTAYDDVKESTDQNEQLPSCTADGQRTWICGNCNKTQTEVIKKTGHNVVTAEVLASCQRFGYVFTYCTNPNCPEAEVESITVGDAEYNVRVQEKKVRLLTITVGDKYDPNNHCVTTGDITPATCTEGGYIVGYCVDCGDHETQKVPALGHDFNKNDKADEQLPTCTEDGYLLVTCSREGCDATEKVPTDKKATGHKYPKEGVTIEATCQSDGYTEYVCETCGNEDKRDIKPYTPRDEYTLDQAEYEHPDCALAPIGEDNGVFLEGDCTTIGLKRYYCPACKEYILVVIDNTGNGHVMPGQTADNTYTKVTFIDEITDGSYVLVADGYAMGVYDGSWITATALTEDSITAPDASLVWTVTVTVNDDGTVTVKLTDASGNTVAPNGGNNNGIIAGDYSWTLTFDDVNDTATFAGTGIDTVTLASNVGVQHKFKAYKNSTISKNPKGFPCNFTMYKLQEAAPAPVEPGVDATCTEAGKTPAYYCAVCGEFVKSEVIPALGHDWEKTPEKPATCTEPGTKETWQCKHCGNFDSEHQFGLIDSLGHDWNVITPAVDATCEKDGATAEMECKRCEERIESEVIPKIDHDAKMAQPIDSDVADCENYGYEHYYCPYCDEEYIKNYVAALGHDWNPDPVVKPDCENAGEKVCDRCGEKEPIPAIGHKNKAGEQLVDDCMNKPEDRLCVNCDKEIGHKHNALVDVHVDATCLDYGYDLELCENCGWSQVTNVDETYLADHTYGDWIAIKEATFTEEGEEKHVCSVCGNTETRVVPVLTGIQFALDIDNAVVSGAGYSDSSLVAVKVSLKTSVIDVWGVRFNVNYNASDMTYVGCEFETKQFISNQMANNVVNDDGAFVSVIATAPNTADGKTQNMTIKENEDFVVLYFRVTLDDLNVTETTFSIEEADIHNNNSKDNALNYYGTEETIKIAKFLDVNGDGSVDLADALIVEQMITGEVETAYNVAVDVDKNGSVEYVDLMYIYEYIVYMINYNELVNLGVEG